MSEYQKCLQSVVNTQHQLEFLYQDTVCAWADNRAGCDLMFLQTERFVLHAEQAFSFLFFYCENVYVCFSLEILVDFCFVWQEAVILRCHAHVVWLLVSLILSIATCSSGSFISAEESEDIWKSSVLLHSEVTRKSSLWSEYSVNVFKCNYICKSNADYRLVHN